MWTGSANFTRGGLILQDNTCIEAQSVTLAKLYRPVFEDLLRKASALAAPTPPRPLKLAGAKVSVYFAPASGEGVDQLCVRLLGEVKKVRLMAFVLTDPDILGALTRFKAARANIKAIVDPTAIATAKKSKTLQASALWWLSDPRVRVARSHPFTSKDANDFQHNKVLILDDRRVICGSYNLSENAEANDENLLLIESPAVAAAYNSYFDAVYATGRINRAK